MCVPGGFAAQQIMRTSAADPAKTLEKPRGIGAARPVLMDKSRDLRVRGFRFAVDVVRFCRAEICSDPILRRLGFQLVDAAGSVGANLEESGAGQSKADFIAKQFVALKEARESRFWLRVIAEVDGSMAPKTKPHIQEASEIIAMLTASIRTAKSNPGRGEPPNLDD